MKKNIKLSTLHRQVLEERQLNEVKGQGAEDRPCQCACAYADRGGSSNLDNGAANARNG